MRTRLLIYELETDIIENVIKSDKFWILVMTCLRYEICFDALEKVLARILSRITTFNAGLWLFT